MQEPVTVETGLETAPAPLEVVRVDNVSKRFLLNQERSLKNRLLHPRKSKAARVDFWALRDLNLSIDAGSTVGLIGPNGSGKSTLLKIIGSIIEPSAGSVSTRGRLAALLELGTGFHPDLTGRENIYLNAAILGLSEAEIDAHFDEIVEFSGMERFIDTQVKFYSSGMYVRLAFSISIHVNPDILLLDEVLAVGDQAFQQKCLEKIREFQQQGRTIFFVSHALDQVVGLCTRALVLYHGRIVFDGAPRKAVEKLRLDFQQEDTGEAVHRELEPGQVAIDRVRVVHDAAEPLRPGAPLVVEVDTTSARDLPEWNLELQVNSTVGSVVMSTSTHQAGMPAEPLPPRARTRFEFPHLHLGSGGYSITADLFDGDRDNVAHADAAAYFAVETPGATSGPVYSDVSASVAPLRASQKESS